MFEISAIATLSIFAIVSFRLPKKGIGPTFFTLLLFLCVFYAPMILISDAYGWYYFSDKGKLIVSISTATSLIGILLATITPSIPSKATTSATTQANLSKATMNLCLMGMLCYLVMYAFNGIPTLSTNVGAARQEFASGSGLITWPARIAMLFGVWSAQLQKDRRLFLSLLITTNAIVLLSGWRGYSIMCAIGILIVASIHRAISFRGLIFAAGFVLLLGLAGVYRAFNSGGSIYGYDEHSVSNFFDLLIVSINYVVLRLGVHANTMDLVVRHFEHNLLLGNAFLMDIAPFTNDGQNVVYYLKSKFADWEDGGGLPPTILGGFFMDFGTTGVGILMLVASYIFAYGNKVLTKITRINPDFGLLVAAWYVSWFYAFLGTYSGYFIQYFSYFFFIFILVSLTLKSLSNIFSSTKSKRRLA